VLVTGGRRFWRETGGSLRDMLDLPSFLKASKDAFGLEYMKGGGAGGCTYPDERPSTQRRWFHHLVFYGVMFDLASTSVAAVYHNFLGREGPYDYLSAPVILGIIGGVMIVAGAAGLLWLKSRADAAPAHRPMLDLDVVFLALLLIVSASGLLLLALRETAAMGTLLALHLALVAALFLTLPYGKFAHVVYRYAALMKNRVEQAREAEGTRP
jgi:citrate/tricarballylate utilization protein